MCNFVIALRVPTREIGGMAKRPRPNTTLTPIDLSELEPPGLAPSTAGLQQRKSSDTRITILNAAIECLADVGYARTTTQLIANTAEVSRGAMLHHYATKQALIESVMDYAFYRHMDQFSREMRALTDRQRTRDNSGVMIDWELYQSKIHKAYLELTVAARTDDDLRAVFIPKARRHDRIWRDELIRVFPEYSADPELLQFSHRLLHSILSGMFLNQEVWDDPAMEQKLLRLLATMLIKLRAEEITVDGDQPTKASRPAVRQL
jgi:AcrR family transcriptional regulator